MLRARGPAAAIEIPIPMRFVPWRRKLPADAVSKPLFTAEDVVRASYAAFLARVPDAPGLAQHAGVLAATPAKLPAVLREFVSCPEGLRANATLLLDSLGTPTRPIVSLGTHCFASEFLKRQGLRPWAGPFDWIFSNVRVVEHCIRDDFATFLDRSHYRPRPPEQRVNGVDLTRVGHAFYAAQFGVSNMFNHHDVHLDADYAYMCRCVERFRAALRSDEPHLFVLFTLAQPGLLEPLQALAAAIAEHGDRGHRVAAFLVDDASAGRLVPAARVEHEDGMLRVLRFESVSTWQPLAFESSIDELVLAKLLRDAASKD